MGNQPPSTKKRIVFLCGLFSFLLVLLALRLGWIQVVERDRYSSLARQQQTADTMVPANRGKIIDRNGQELAASATAFTVWVRPEQAAAGETEKAQQATVQATAATLAGILSRDQAELEAILTSEKNQLKVAKNIDKAKADEIRAAKLPGISLVETVRRFYPQGPLAGYVLGGTNDDNQGLTGLELKYEKYLSGTPGRWIKNKDARHNSLSYGIQKYYQASDGLTVQLTIDEVIQHYAEQGVAAVRERTKAERVTCVMMNPKTGEVLALAVSPGFDPNDPRVPLDAAMAEILKKTPDDKKIDFWNKMWRNPIICDTYEPGSTFKLITTAMALEERVSNPNEMFFDKGYIMVGGTKLSCWRAERPHGNETLTQAVENSCNPVFVQLAQRLGAEKYYNYLGRFGLMEKTGIDYPGEGNNILQNQATAGPVGLATMSYGQGIAVTPISLITAVSALGNQGKLMQPYLVKALLSSDGKTVKTFSPTPVRQVVSAKTAAEMCLIMESVVAEGGGSKAQIPGYRIGGKTGTAQKVVNGRYTDQTDSSFIGMVPMDDPQIAILLVINSPQGVKFGGMTAAPGAREILEPTLRYLHIKPDEKATKAAEQKLVQVPNVTGINYSKAKARLTEAGLKAEVSPENTAGTDFSVIDQYPKAGEKTEAGSVVMLYWK